MVVVIRRSLRALVGSTLAASLAAGLVAVIAPLGAATPTADAAPRERRVYFVTDSVGLGARTALPTAFGPDWDVTVDGTPALFVEQLESKHVRQRMAATPEVFGDAAVVAGGYNYSYWDPPRFDRSVDSIIAALREAGVSHIFWVTLRDVKPQYISSGAWREVQPYYWYFPEVNARLEAAVSRHPDLTLVDWAAVADQPGLTYDAIHLNPTGAAVYSQLVASTVHDTLDRPARGAEHAVVVAGRGGVPADAAAVAVNLTVVAPRSSGFLTAAPCGGDRPTVSNANFVRDQVVASAAVVPVGADGSICVYGNESTHVVVDVSGSFPAGSGFVALRPDRLVDTRSAGPRQPGASPLVVPVLGRSGVPTDADAVVVTVTATEPVAGGFATVAACGSAPTGTSNVNFDRGATVPNLVVVAPGADGTICVTSNVDTHLIVDVFGAFSDGADVGLVVPQRLVDTREAAGTAPDAGGVVRLPIAGTAGVPAGATGVMVNLTAAGPRGAGFLTAYPCSSGPPTASNLNVRAGVNRANFVIVAPDAAGEVCVYSSVRTDVIVDLLGWVGDTFVGTVPTRVLDTRG